MSNIVFKEENVTIPKILSPGEKYTVVFEFTGDPSEILHIAPGCFDKETDVLTNKGWINWKNITGDELFYSLDPISKKTEYVKAIDIIRYKTKNILNIESKTVSLGVSHEHNHITVNNRKGDGLKASTIDDIKNSQRRFLCAVENSWVGKNKEYITIGSYTWSFNDYTRIMAWFLSEGCCFKKKNRNVYVLDIRQSEKKYLNEIKELFQRCFNKKGFGTNRYSIYVDKKTGEFFSTFGKSFEKYIPNDIKQSSVENISLFLDTYVKGDSSIKTRYKNIEKSIYTSSINMVNDLTELIIKSGKRVSTKIRNNKLIVHNNGTFISKFVNYQINILSSNTASVSSSVISEVEYNDFVYSVSLEKWNTLFVRRRGKYLISGNCGCTANCKVVGNTIQADYTDQTSSAAQKGIFDFSKSLRVFLKDEKELWIQDGMNKTINNQKTNKTIKFNGKVQVK